MTEAVCEICGKKFAMKDFEKLLRRCQWCNRIMCLDCTRYIGVRKSGLFKDYVDVIRICKDCYPKRER